ncbi:CLIP domain-containing serine protease B4-like [Anopheles maculipalpis]|uniref:CLIP domain-containing serine protease B4-like n=1 Tax=Anopheles maculipalpis TaxID=1496333 RepID=UPI0021590B7A|nr:CLIP domain-containing serine protease B4-like [Anopheles maculipalpis]
MFGRAAFLVWWTVSSVAALELGQKCLTPVGEPGECIPFRECQPLIDIYNKPVPTPDDTRFLTESRCGMLERKTLVCCTVSSKKSSLPESPHCGLQVADRVIGGQPTEIDEFPWTALIEFEKPDGSFGFHCGGSLINERYIVTAAHCIKSIPRGWKVHRVRLGEWDLTTANDCQNDFCSHAPIDLDVEQIVVHNNYDPKDQSNANDIALIRFTRQVRYSQTVRPICLPWSASLRSRDHVGQPSWAAGWGKTETATASEKKLKVAMNVTSLQDCAPAYRRGGILLKATHMCAGGVRGKDTCSGDSGGPLMRQITGAWYLIGVVSFGPQKCGTAGIPGVYTNVADFVDWIQDNIY